MRIIVLCNRDLASCVALNHLLPALAAHEVFVLQSSSVGAPGKDDVQPPALQELKFYEQQLFTDILFPLFAASHGHKSTQLRSFAALGALLEQPVEGLNNINQPAGLARVSALAPDLMLSIRYGVILKDAALAIPAMGVINLHSGILPDYKGVMATFRALSDGNKTIGSTLHWIDDSSIDTGRIIEVCCGPVVVGKSYLWHVLTLYRQGCQAMAHAVAQLASGKTLAAKPQPSGGHYYSFPTQDELEAFQQSGWNLVDPAEIEIIAKQFMV